MRCSRRSGVLACLVLAAACSDPSGTTDGRAELENARRLWDVRGGDDYQMTVGLWGAWRGGSAVIQVRNGVPVSVQPVGELHRLPIEAFQAYDTVEELFGVLDHAIADGADEVDAAFHSRFGVPVQVSIDQASGMADDEYGFSVESFQLQ